MAADCALSLCEGEVPSLKLFPKMPLHNEDAAAIRRTTVRPSASELCGLRAIVNYNTSLCLELHTRVHLDTVIHVGRRLRWERFRVNVGNVMKELILASAGKRWSYYLGCS